MGNERLTYEELLQIFALLEKSSSLTDFHMKAGDIEIDLTMRRDGVTAAVAPQAPEVSQSGEVADSIAIAARPYTGTAQYPPGAVIVTAPMVGTFYRANEPGAKPFIEVGSRVTPDSTICIIEVMKLMSSIPAGAAGVVTHILVEDAVLVEADQPLVVINPAG
jgi:acetyl-CoA carboxylase biotin carboxyl carrier protein